MSKRRTVYTLENAPRNFKGLLQLNRGIRFRLCIQLQMAQTATDEQAFLGSTDEQQVALLLPALKEFHNELPPRELLQRCINKFEGEKKQLIRSVGDDSLDALLVLYHSWVASDMRAIVRLEDARKALGR